MSLPPTVRLFDLDVLACTQTQAIALLSDVADRRDGRMRVVVTPNVDHLVRLDGMQAFRSRYASADYIFADGMPVVWASRLLGRPLPERVTGADLMLQLCELAPSRGWRVAVLGGEPGEEAELEAAFARRFPGIRVAIRCPSMQFDPEGPEGDAAAEWVRAQQADVICVCVGMPKQEKWALRHADSLPGGVALCVGAAMHFAIGRQRRAPRWVQRAGFEWLWRLASDPRRLWRRYLVDDRLFLKLCWREWRQSNPAGGGR